MLNEILGSAARFNQTLTRKFGITGGAPSPQLTPEIAPVYAFPLNLEDRILAGEIVAAGTKVQIAVAGIRSAIQLNNPTGSNIVVVVEHIEGYSGSADVVAAGIIAALPLPALPNPGDVTWRDTRTRSNGGAYTREPVARITSTGAGGAPAYSGGNLFLRNVAANIEFEYDTPFVLGPGYCIQFNQATVNEVLICSFAWREVPLAQGEVGPF
jgi:hypothetical protein